MLTLISRNLDMAAIGLSAACLMHCLMLPLVLILTPLASAHWVGNESLHAALLLLTLPTSTIALFTGCRRHGRTSLYYLGGSGLGLLIVAWWLEAYLGSTGGRIATAIGGSLLALAHIRNFRLCRKHDCAQDECGQAIVELRPGEK